MIPATGGGRKTIAAIVMFVMFVALGTLSALLASRIQTDDGKVKVSNVSFRNKHGLMVRGKLLIPTSIPSGARVPGVVFIPGYQSVRERGDGLCIELARRGFAALSIDAIGRGNSDIPTGVPGDPEFDETYGGQAALDYLRSLKEVDEGRIGIMGHSLGGNMAYKAALVDPSLMATAMIGTAYSEEATPRHPKNMMMAIGKYDEHRQRMTRTRDIEAQWMKSPETVAAFGRDDAVVGKTYGDFSAGTARLVIVPPITHEGEVHSAEVVAGVVNWMEKALNPEGDVGLSATKQIWHFKEWLTLAMMFFGFASLFPLAFLLMRSRVFRGLPNTNVGEYACSKRDFKKFFSINCGLMWLYLPSALILFGIHKYVVPIDGVLPLMIVNVVLGWLLISNGIGYGMFKRWAKRHPLGRDALYADLGIGLKKSPIMQTLLYVGLLFGFIYGFQYLLENLWIVDFRYVFAFASDLTPYRWLMFWLYLPLFSVGFIFMGFFLHGQLRCAKRKTLLGTLADWSLRNLAVMLVPMLLLLAVQYIPLYTTGFIPLVGPGSMFVLLIINIFHILGVFAVVIPLSTWLYLLSGRPYAGALLNAAIVTWMFASSQVISPIPI